MTVYRVWCASASPLSPVSILDIMNEGVHLPSHRERANHSARIVFFVLFNELSHEREKLFPTRSLKDMAGFPPPGFGNSGKCFLMENLLSSPAPGVRGLKTPSGNTT